LSSRGDQEQESSVDGGRVPELPMSPPSTDEIEDHLREGTPSEHWEDGYDQDEEEETILLRPTLRDSFFKEPPTRARTPVGRSMPTTIPGDAAEDSMESNPWAS